MTTLYVISGHGGGGNVDGPYTDPGACGNGYEEAYLVRQLAKRIKELGGDSVVLAPQGNNCYADQGILNWSIPSGAQLVELHMDSASAAAKGAHVIYKSGYNPDQYDTALANFISGVFPGRSNVLVGRSDLRNVNQSAIKGYSYRLVENGFISNAGDVEIFLNRLDDIARGYLEAFGIAVQEAAVEEIPVVEEAPAAEPEIVVTPEPETPVVEETVVSDAIEEDGWIGAETIKALQKQLGSQYVDGIVSDQYSGNKKYLARCVGGAFEFVSNPTTGSTVAKLLQAKIGVEADGFIGKNTVKALQKFLGVTADGYLGKETALAFQKAINAKKFA